MGVKTDNDLNLDVEVLAVTTTFIRSVIPERYIMFLRSGQYLLPGTECS
jgi:hypothetical protein